MLAIVISAFHYVATHQEYFAFEELMLAIFALAMPLPCTRRLLHRSIVAGRIVASHPATPKWAKVALIVACTIPIPGPVDEIIGGITIFILRRIGHGPIVRQAWADAAR